VFGGNGDVALGWTGLVREFAGPRTSFLLIDYPGYGICEGRPNPQSILENSERALQALLEQKRWKLDADALCVLGHSLGGAAALQFAAKHPVRKILLVSTFTSIDDLVRAQIQISLGPLLRHRFDNLTSLKAILSQNQAPEIYIFHGEADEVIPLKMGRALAQLDGNRIKFVEIPRARHNDVIEAALPLGLQSTLFESTQTRTS
jgi:pimeloyl-ACP methyl ester carboxylesterase